MNRFSTMLTVSLLCLGLAIPAGDAVAQSAKDLVGAWTPVSVAAFGSNPKGTLIFDANGRFYLQLLRSDLPKIASNKRDMATPEENKAIISGSIAYYGTYTMNGTDLMLRVEGCSFPNWTGTEQKRPFTLAGDELKYIVPTSSAGDGRGEVILKRAK